MATTTTTTTRTGRNQEFTAIVLAGLGGGLIPFTNSENLPKALLPVANRALLSYPLSWIERAGISSVIILCVDAHEAAITSWLKTSWKAVSSPRPLVVAASSEDELVGSADAIRTLLKNEKYADKLRAEFIILSCDTICEIPPHALLDAHRLSRASVTAVFYANHAADVLTPLKKGSKTFTGYEASSETLLYTAPVADVDEGDDLELRASMLWKYPRVHLTSALNDAHIYLCRRSVLDLVCEQDAISRLATDLLPLLCRAQFTSLLRKRYGLDPGPGHDHEDGGSKTTTTTPPPVSVKLYIAPPEYFCARAHTRQAYIDLNRHLLKGIPADAREPPASTTIGDRTTVGPDSALGHDSAIDEKTTIKRTLVGNHVRIGKMCRITNCILMDGAVVRDAVKLENCVLCAGAVIGEKSTLRDCTVGGKVVLPDKSERKGEEIVIGGEISMGGD